jgi:hypothetical protein
MNDMYSVAFIPFLEVNEIIKFGDYVIWSYHKGKNNFIENDDVINQLDLFFERFYEFDFGNKESREKRERKDIVTPDIAIIQQNSALIGEHKSNNEEHTEIRDIISILAFYEFPLDQCIDRYDLMSLSIKIGNEKVFFNGTQYINFTCFKIYRSIYNRKQSLPLNNKVSRNAKVLIEKIREIKSDESLLNIYEAILNFRGVLTMNHLMPDNLKILNMMMCFELLIGSNNKLELISHINKLIPQLSQHCEYRTFRKNNIEIKKELPLSLCWLYDHYTLRSKIVHGVCKESHWGWNTWKSLPQRIEFCNELVKYIIHAKLLNAKFIGDDIIDGFILYDDLDTKLINILENN